MCSFSQTTGCRDHDGSKTLPDKRSFARRFPPSPPNGAASPVFQTTMADDHIPPGGRGWRIPGKPAIDNDQR
ncbi:MAG: hypothetical protein SFX18_13230 [Pirellulales bacterium]|nr:hypothetical protein [Pirellulales bacterium]